MPDDLPGQPSETLRKPATRSATTNGVRRIAPDVIIGMTPTTTMIGITAIGRVASGIPADARLTADRFGVRLPVINITGQFGQMGRAVCLHGTRVLMVPITFINPG